MSFLLELHSKVLITSLAMISPIEEGTKLEEPGVPLLLSSLISTLIGSSLEYTTLRELIFLFLNS